MAMTRNDTTARQRREVWGSLRKLPSKRWQARYTGPDDKVYSARTEDDKPLTFLTKGDAREWLNGGRAKIGGRGEWLYSFRTPFDLWTFRRVRCDDCDTGAGY